MPFDISQFIGTTTIDGLEYMVRAYMFILIFELLIDWFTLPIHSLINRKKR